MNDINVRNETVPMGQKNSTPKDMAGQKFEPEAGTASKEDKYTCRDYKCAKMTSPKRKK